MEKKASYFKGYSSILENRQLSPIDRIVLIEVIAYWKLRTTPKYILLGKEKLAYLAGTERHTIKRVLDNLIEKDLITIYNYDEIKNKNRTLPQIAVKEYNINSFFQDRIFEKPGEFQKIEMKMTAETPKQETSIPTRKVQNINYINEINKRLRDGN